METIVYGKKATGFLGKMWVEFRDFAFKGNMIDLAVAVVLGAAFKDVITSIVTNIIMPLISYVDVGKASEHTYRDWHLGRITIGLVIGDLLNFVLVAAAVFFVIVKIVGLFMRRAMPNKSAPSEPTTKECPMCLSNIPLKARKCAHCTSDLAVEPGMSAAPSL